MATAISRHESRSQSQPEQRRVRATLALDFQRSANSGQTHLRASTQQPPLRVIRAFAREDGSCLAHLHNVSGGILGGDHLALDVKIGPRANVQITTTGATRIYRPRAISAPAEQHNKIEIAAGALLEYVPDPIIPYAGARFSQSTEIHLAPGAALFWWEVLAPGREARGEIFAYERVDMRAEIFASGRIIAADQVRLEPQSRALESPARLGDFRCWITFYICREGLEPAHWLALENELRDVARPFAASGESLWGISALAAHGLAIRGLARRGLAILDALHALWRAAKLSLYGREPILPRKVN
jgi:urease accessory protein